MSRKNKEEAGYGSISITNFDNLVDKKVMPKTHPLMLQYNFACIISGSSGTGKTNILMNVLMKHLFYDDIYIFIKDPSEDKYQLLDKYFESIKEQRPDFNYLISNDLSEIPDPNEFEDNERVTIFVFDDLVTVKNQDAISEITIRGRKRNISWFYLTQKFFDVPAMIREQANYVLLFKSNRKTLIEYMKNFADDVDKEGFYKMYAKATQNRYSFMMIDMKTDSDVLKYRSGFDGVNLIKYS